LVVKRLLLNKRKQWLKLVERYNLTLEDDV